jgi:hypothetical protein
VMAVRPETSARVAFCLTRCRNIHGASPGSGL